MATRIFVFGPAGMLGWTIISHLKERGHETVPVGRGLFDIRFGNAEEWADRERIGPGDVLINAAALTNRFLDSATEEEFFAVNAAFPKALDAIAGRSGSRLLHFSTDAVFDGTQGSYVESSLPSPSDAYSRSKHAGEMLKHGVVLRISVIGVERTHFRNLLSWVLSNEGGAIDGYTNHRWNGVTALEVAKAAERFITDGFPAPDLYHFFSMPVITKYDAVRLIAECFDIGVAVRAAEARQPVFRDLASEKQLCHSLSVPHLAEQLSELRAFCEKNNVSWKPI